jgi:trigger factor
MNIVRKDIDACNAIIAIEVKKEDYSSEVDKALKDYRRKANIPGFRVGMAPAGMIKRMVGKSIVAEEVHKILSKSLYEYIDENKIDVLGDPLPNETEQKPVNFDEDEDFEFKFDIGIAPEINIELEKKDKIHYYKINITKDMEEKQIKFYLARMGKFVPVDEAKDSDLMNGDLTEIKESEDAFQVLDARITLEFIKENEQKKLFVGKKVGDRIVFNPIKAFENEHEIASLLNISKNKIRDYDTDFEYVVKEITRRQEAELDQNVFDAVLGHDMVNNEEDFRKHIKQGLEKTYALDSDYKLVLDIKEFLLKKIETLEFPEDFIKRWLKATNEKVTDKVLEKEFVSVLDHLKWDLIISSIAKSNDIKVEESDIKEAAKEIVTAQFAQYNLNNIPDNTLDNYIEASMQKERHREEFYKKALQDKVVRVVKKNITLTNKKISIEEFENLLKNSEQKRSLVLDNH